MKYVFIILGLIFLGMGTIGVVLPVLPTTPFLILASVCFARGSNRFNDWFKSTKIYKNNLESFEINRSMTIRTKICILIPASLMLLLAFIVMNNIYGRIVIVIVVLVKYYYFIFKIKTVSLGSFSKVKFIVKK